jgi:hypothetical protein
MTKYEIIKYLYENNVRGDFTIEQMAEDIVDASQKEYKRGRLDALNELKAYIREMGAYDTADTPQTDCLIVDARFKAHCLNCAESGSYKCTKCDGEMYYKDAPQTDCGWK